MNVGPTDKPCLKELPLQIKTLWMLKYDLIITIIWMETGISLHRNIQKQIQPSVTHIFNISRFRTPPPSSVFGPREVGPLWGQVESGSSRSWTMWECEGTGRPWSDIGRHRWREDRTQSSLWWTWSASMPCGSSCSWWATRDVLLNWWWNRGNHVLAMKLPYIYLVAKWR